MFEFIKQIPNFLEVIKEGKEVSNPVTWKNKTVAANAVLALLGTAMALSKGFGYDLKIDSDTLQNLAVGVVAFVGAINAIVHVITDKRIGLSSDSGSGPAEGQANDNAGNQSG